MTGWQLVREYYRMCGPARHFILLQMVLVIIDAVLQASVQALENRHEEIRKNIRKSGKTLTKNIPRSG